MFIVYCTYKQVKKKKLQVRVTFSNQRIFQYK